MISEYLVFNLIIILGPVLGRFFYSRSILPKTKQIIFSISLASLFFVVWDILVTDYFWSFNYKYVLGYKFVNIPVEELLFFFTVPYACLFLYVNFKNMLREKIRITISPFYITFFLVFSLFLSLLSFFIGKYYTFSVLLVWSLVLFFDKFLLKTCVSLNLVYWLFIFIVFFLTLFFNYYLTSRPVVLYNKDFNLNLNLLTIPVEDFLYSFSLISLVVIVYEFLQRDYLGDFHKSK